MTAGIHRFLFLGTCLLIAVQAPQAVSFFGEDLRGPYAQDPTEDALVMDSTIGRARAAVVAGFQGRGRSEAAATLAHIVSLSPLPGAEPVDVSTVAAVFHEGSRER